MFNFFNNAKHEDEQDDTVIASITYLIKEGDKSIHIDVSLEDFEERSINSLCSLLDILGNDNCYIDTINVVKQLFTKEERHDILIKMFTKIDANLRSKIIESAKERIKDQPCIKPSEMFR
jgi:hypothetical protein